MTVLRGLILDRCRTELQTQLVRRTLSRRKRIPAKCLQGESTASQVRFNGLPISTQRVMFKQDCLKWMLVKIHGRNNFRFVAFRIDRKEHRTVAFEVFGYQLANGLTLNLDCSQMGNIGG